MEGSGTVERGAYRQRGALAIGDLDAFDDAARLAAACEKYKFDQCGSVKDLLVCPGLDAVIIGAETSLHADLVEAAAAARKRIILQKPLCLTMAEADAKLLLTSRFEKSPRSRFPVRFYP